MKRAGVLGYPISHSLSPALHGHWLDRLGIDGSYEAVAVEPGNFNETADRLLRTEGWRGFNVTIPHKEAAYDYCDIRDAAANVLGAVNTVIVKNDGTIEGRNTDLYGFRTNLEADPAWRNIGRGKAVLIGAGGAARAVLRALSDWRFTDICIANRTPDRAMRLIDDLGVPKARVIAMDGLAAALTNTDLLINSTSLGMTGQSPLDLPLDRLPTDAMVTDIVYAPLETALLAKARGRGNPVVDGLGMLLHQAAAGFQAWFETDQPPPVDQTLRDHVLAARDRLR